jgi:hypothetical protein
MTTAVAEKTSTTKNAEPPRKPPVIDPAWVEINESGFIWKTVSVRLPEAATLADLNENRDMWRLLQGDRNKSLERLDRVSVFAYDESWVVDAIVSGASVNGVVLAITKKTDLPPRTEGLYEDDIYRISWAGVGYVVIRKADGVRQTQPVPSYWQAQEDLRRKYTRAG